MSARTPSTSIDKHVGGVIRRHRKQLELSLDALAGAVGVSYQQLQKYERGTNRVSVGRLDQLAAALNIPVETFFAGADELQAIFRTNEGKRLVRAYLAIEDPAERRAIVTLAEGLSRRPALAAGDEETGLKGD